MTQIEVHIEDEVYFSAPFEKPPNEISRELLCSGEQGISIKLRDGKFLVCPVSKAYFIVHPTVVND
jgi:hypothetical protein